MGVPFILINIVIHGSIISLFQKPLQSAITSAITNTSLVKYILKLSFRYYGEAKQMFSTMLTMLQMKAVAS